MAVSLVKPRTSQHWECCYFLVDKNRNCRHKVPFDNMECYQHREPKFERPKECPICGNNYLKYWRPCQPCQHWVCPECIVRSGKRQCPFCRVQLQIPRAYELQMRFWEGVRHKEEVAEQERLSRELIERQEELEEVRDFMNILLEAVLNSFQEYPDEFIEELLELDQAESSEENEEIHFLDSER